jgi:hypothetical protein
MPIFARAHTPQGYVVRTRNGPAGETAYRHAYFPDSTITVCYGHKGPWIVTNAALIPADVLSDFANVSEVRPAAIAKESA